MHYSRCLYRGRIRSRTQEGYLILPERSTGSGWRSWHSVVGQKGVAESRTSFTAWDVVVYQMRRF